MGPDKIKHFLLIYDIERGEVKVKGFGTDYERALPAYEAAKRAHRERDVVDIVLLGADSLATIKNTHSSYFAKPGELREELLSSQ